MKKSLIYAFAVMTCVAFQASAGIPSGYYNKTDGLTGQALLQALESIVGPHTTVSYDQLWTLYKYSDVTSDGYIWDMYSTAKFRPGNDQCGNYKNIGDCYNREHSFPKSWFNKATPMVSDAFHVVPTDGKVNSYRGNMPYGVCEGGTYPSGSGTNKSTARYGKSTYSGYSGTVFEPADEYKGDFARSYFYMAAAYNNRIANWSSDMLAGNSYPAYKTWAINMLLEWNRLDPVSDKEIKRNEAIYNGGGGSYKQNNRNPFIDHPELAEYIWGDKKGQAWSASGVPPTPAITAPTASTTVDFGVVAAGSTTSRTITVKGINLTKSLTISVSGTGFTTSTASISATNAMQGVTVTVYYAAASADGTYKGTLTVSSTEANSVSIPLSATVTTGIPARLGTVTSTSFEACWTPVAGASTYQLYVYDNNDNVLSGYPISVSASMGKYTVSGLKPLTTYKFKLTASGISSNTVTVTTADVQHIIDIITDGNFVINAFKGQSQLPMLEAEVYTENIDEQVTLEVEGEKFDISLDGKNWSKILTIDPDGETFYVRLNNTSAEGTFVGLLSAYSDSYVGDEADIRAIVTVNTNIKCGDVTGDGVIDIADVNAIVNLILETGQTYMGSGDVDRDGVVDIADLNAEINLILGYGTEKQTVTVVEDWENTTNGGYWTKKVDGNLYAWDFTDAGIWGDPKTSGALSCRLGKTSTSVIAMAEDNPNGAKKFSFLAAPFGTDEAATLDLYYSTNSGSTWTKASSFNIALNNNLKEYSCDLNIEGKVRFKLVQTAGKRVNIDDITITSEVESSNASIANSNRDWNAVAIGNGIEVTVANKQAVEIYNLDADRVASAKVSGTRLFNLPAGTYVVVCGKQSHKVIVK